MPARIETPEAHPHVALVTIDRPDHANALDPETLRDLAAHWHHINEDEAIRVAILTGAGDRVFCSGMDMKKTIPASQAFARGERVDPLDFEGLRAVGRATLVEEPLRVPLIAAVNGDARAGGFDLMLASQIRYAVASATFALEEVALGLFPTGQATVALPRQIAEVHAAELLYTGEPIDAERALTMGLLNELVVRSGPPTESRATPPSRSRPRYVGYENWTEWTSRTLISHRRPSVATPQERGCARGPACVSRKTSTSLHRSLTRRARDHHAHGPSGQIATTSRNAS
ncbi:MAG: hypothetical protein CL933_23340 [Deltaproteobacteria bacterium]|nr:hypothetical protein [Deltaproteobacteria bacterium]